jgi:hypothetical protein
MPFKQHPTDPTKVIYKTNEYCVPKPWVGLTDKNIEEVYEITSQQTLRPQDRHMVLAFAQAVEAKLKDKNDATYT